MDSSDLGIPYDYESVMHYPFNAFAIDKTQPVIVPKQRGARIGQNKNLSPLDVVRIQKAYGCDTVLDPNKMLSTSVEGKSKEDLPQATRNINALQPTTPFPAFEFRCVRWEEWNGLAIAGCAVPLPDNPHICESELPLSVHCASFSSELLTVSFAMAALNARRPITFDIFDNQTSLEVFKPVSQEVILLAIKYCSTAYTTSKLPTLNVPNLLDLSFGFCAMMIIRKEDFARNWRLRMLGFHKVSFRSIQIDTFVDLQNLVFLSLDFYWTKPFTAELASSSMKLHCDCEYSWLRKLLQQNPVLIAPKADYEVYKFGLLSGGQQNLSKIFVPVDCGQPALNRAVLNLHQKDFTVNDPCL